MEIQRKTLPVASFKVMDADQGIAEMIVSVFSNKDAAGESIKPGFFKESLARKLPKGVWMHEWSTPVAKTLEAKELLPGNALLPESVKKLGGLYVKGQFNLETQRGREAFSDLKFGTVDEFSIGYLVQEETYDKGTDTRWLIKGDLYEWSPVLVGCNPATALIGVKSHSIPTEEPETMNVSGASVETKGQYLGEYIEGRMTYQALSSLVDALFYNVFYQVIYGSWEWDAEEEEYIRTAMPVEEGVTTIQGACAEFTALAVKVYQSLMAGAGEDAITEAKSLRVLFSDPKISAAQVSTKDMSPAGVKFAAQSDQVLAAVKDFIVRADAVKALRVKDGRVLSQATRTKLGTHLDSLKSACKTIEDMIGDAAGEDGEKSTGELVLQKAVPSEDLQEQARAAHQRLLISRMKALGIDLPAPTSPTHE